VVTQAGGAVEVDTAPGRGTTFRVFLPAAGEVEKRPPGSSAVRAVPRGTETVLLAEDEEGVRALTRHVLRNAGYVVLEAGDGTEAVAVAAAHPGPIHLLVTDVVMPGLGGRETAERLVSARPGRRVRDRSGYTDAPPARELLCFARRPNPDRRSGSAGRSIQTFQESHDRQPSAPRHQADAAVRPVRVYVVPQAGDRLVRRVEGAEADRRQAAGGR